MKKLSKILFALGIFFITAVAFAQTNLSLTDKQEISKQLDTLAQAVNDGDAQKISNMVSPSNQELQSAIQEHVKGGIVYRLDYDALDKNVEMSKDNKVKVKARFAASGVGWNIQGLSTYFVFEKQDNHWMLADSDFYKKLSADYVFSILKKVLLIVGPIAALFFAFWLWMLIDCIKRDFNDKTLWIILLIFFSFIAAVLYYFIVKRRNVTREPLRFKG